MTRYTTMPSPVGELLLSVDPDAALTGVYLPPHVGRGSVGVDWRRDDAALAEPVRQLGEYFAGRRTCFDLTLAPAGTEFQRRVWAVLVDIPYGETTSYGAIALRLGQPRASRAVGLANGRNPISIVVPCHRVVGADGRLVGYGGGLDRKRQLLALEAARARPTLL